MILIYPLYWMCLYQATPPADWISSSAKIYIAFLANFSAMETMIVAITLTRLNVEVSSKGMPLSPYRLIRCMKLNKKCRQTRFIETRSSRV